MAFATVNLAMAMKLGIYYGIHNCSSSSASHCEELPNLRGVLCRGIAAAMIRIERRRRRR
jgi:hypothetical protein